MIEKFTPEEIQILIKELKESGYEVKKTGKTRLLHEEAVKVFGGDPFVGQWLNKYIYGFADYITNNYEEKETKKGVKQVNRTTVPADIESEYRIIVNALLRLAKPCYGKVGFCDRDHI